MTQLKQGFDQSHTVRDFSGRGSEEMHSKLICKLASYGIADDLLVWLKKICSAGASVS